MNNLRIEDAMNFDYGSQMSDSKEGLMAKRSLLTII